MKSTEKENNLLFFFTFVLLVIFKFSFMGFSYIPYLDDYVQYLYYSHLFKPFSEILFGGAGTAFTRPLAAILDIFFWSYFFKFPYLAVILLSILFGLSGIFFYLALKKLKIPVSPLFLIIYALLPSLSEGTYWISAATRIVPGLFFTSLALFFMVRCKKLLFFIFSLLSNGFYEQVCILSFFCSLLIFLSAPKKFYKEFLLAMLSAMLIALYYFLFGKMGDNSERLSFDVRFYMNFKSNLYSLSDLFFTKQAPLYTKGFLRGVSLIKATKSNMWFLTLSLISLFLFIFSPEEKFFCYSKKKILVGIVLFIAPVLPFWVLKEPWLNFRNLVPSVLGFAIILDAVFSSLLKHRVKYLVFLFSIYLCICNVSEVWDYHKTAEHDKKIIYKIADTYNGDNEIFYEIRTEKYLEQNSPYHDHIMSIIGSDWGLTGTVRAILKNKNVVVNQKDSP